MNAALETGDFSGLECCAGAGSSRNENIIRAERLGNKIAVDHLSAFWCRLGCAGSCIQRRDEATAESLHAGEGVRLAAQILQVQSCSLCRCRLGRRANRQAPTDLSIVNSVRKPVILIFSTRKKIAKFLSRSGRIPKARE